MTRSIGNLCRKVKVRKVTKGDRVLWELDAGKIDGKRHRHYFKTEAEAKRRQREIEADRKQVGGAWAAIDTRDKLQTLLTLREIRDAGLTVSDVWQEYLKLKDMTGLRVTLLDTAQREMMEAKRKENKRGSYLETLDYCTKRFCRRFQGWKAHEITLEHVKNYLDEFDNDSTRHSEHTRLATLLSYCHTQQFRRDNPFTKLKPPRVDYGRPKVLTPEQANALMDATQALDKPLVPSMALKLFAGVRPDEAARLTWNDYHADHGELVIDAAASKVRNVRIVKLPANCVKILESAVTDFLDKKHKPIQPSRNYRKRFEVIRQKAGLVDVWAKDILRHTAASYYYHANGAVETSKAFGHSESVLFKHYRALVNDRDCETFYKIWLAPIAK